MLLLPPRYFLEMPSPFSQSRYNLCLFVFLVAFSFLFVVMVGAIAIACVGAVANAVASVKMCVVSLAKSASFSSFEHKLWEKSSFNDHHSAELQSSAQSWALITQSSLKLSS